ncbi:COMM domain-containing protein 3 isoform X1 [Salvelinus namaycush]|uniref:COMM domain-containing protein 3 n=1 Tax=Salvelinus namaycush TaxID=8040 RepID=A0A8U0TUZ2_SALNM|nr:COMM domain-containing protein 3 isoform X1 [Salvelinus namaycush]
MELSESVRKGLQSLADPTLFDLKTFSVLIELAFRSLLTAHADRSVLDQPELKHIDQKLLKHCHTAATTCILEGVKQNVDKSTISGIVLEIMKIRLKSGGIAHLRQLVGTTTYLCHTCAWRMLGLMQREQMYSTSHTSIGRCPPHINDVSWRLEYLIKNGHVHKVNEPSYLISLNVENTNNGGSTEEVNFSCTMEQLQDLVGKMKDATKSLEKAMQL